MTMLTEEELTQRLNRIQTDLILLTRKLENLRNPNYVPPGDAVVYIVDAKKGMAGKEREVRDTLTRLEQDVTTLGWSVSGIEYSVSGLRHYRRIAELPVKYSELAPKAAEFIKRMKESEK